MALNKILVAMIPMPGNRILKDLTQELSKDWNVSHNHDVFWSMVYER